MTGSSERWQARLFDGPVRVNVVDGETDGWYATFTVGAYTATLAGPHRRLEESRRRLEHATWVRVLPTPFQGEIDVEWLEEALDANRRGVPDVLALAFQYVKGSPRVFDGGLQVAGAARYGPRSNDSREEGADFNDYLGMAWSYVGEPIDLPETRQIRSLDCSGFVRMVFGFRRSLPSAASSSVPLCRAPRPDSSAVPRRANEIYTRGPGVVVIEDAGVSPLDVGALAPGDLVFFDADPDAGSRLDHVGIYVGLDRSGHRRFVSSRKRANGPTMDDVGGRSTLDGDGRYARAFRSARRL